jgi:hypothetical protein
LWGVEQEKRGKIAKMAEGVNEAVVLRRRRRRRRRMYYCGGP